MISNDIKLTQSIKLVGGGGGGWGRDRQTDHIVYWPHLLLHKFSPKVDTERHLTSTVS